MPPKVEKNRGVRGMGVPAMFPSQGNAVSPMFPRMRSQVHVNSFRI